MVKIKAAIINSVKQINNYGIHVNEFSNSKSKIRSLLLLLLAAKMESISEVVVN